MRSGGLVAPLLPAAKRTGRPLSWSLREIQGHLLEIYGLDVSPDLISTVTDVVLETSYPLVFFDAMRVKIRDEGLVRNKAVYLALGVQADGTKDILIAVVDGLKGFPEAINAVFPQAIVQTCVVHLIRLAGRA